jgi:hypothetical protein
MVNRLNEKFVYLFDFHAYINEMHGSRSKITSKKSRCAEGFNSGFEWLRPAQIYWYLQYFRQRVRATK